MATECGAINRYEGQIEHVASRFECITSFQYRCALCLTSHFNLAR